ncbi:hypothetical protein CGLO_01104 [Colletotrichum gloeosporioides Cg-14]|uniref:Uncharacterized protein n=1 Tax=Colletotrichum gloeosporioides (strain Cg-14) TaxID=1237896 RepID=T0L2E8_COLGC|nr:hypothetical protein CGLO_01104 [Colletotrichum gloeosporioides Cg-14]
MTPKRSGLAEFN